MIRLMQTEYSSVESEQSIGDNHISDAEFSDIMVELDEYKKLKLELRKKVVKTLEEVKIGDEEKTR